jgi:hypothetical protein
VADHAQILAAAFRAAKNMFDLVDQVAVLAAEPAP